MKSMRVLISGGGTGGHVYPLLAVLAELQTQEGGDVKTLYVGRADSIEERLARRNQIAFHPIQAGGIRGLAPWTALRNLSSLITSTLRVRECIRSFHPDVILVTGGYVSAPVIWAGAAEHIPSVIYLPDLEPGWAIRVTAYWATRVAVSFEDAKFGSAKGKTVVTGYPVRPGFLSTNRTDARARLQLEADLPTVTVLGGSRGAHAINRSVVSNLTPLTNLVQIILIAGSEDEAWVQSQVQGLARELQRRIRVFGYVDDLLPIALSAANLVVARAGAATLGEFPVLGLPSILVPYPYAGHHQEKNARFLVERGAAIRIHNSELEKELVPTLTRLLEDPERLARLAGAARALARPDAAGKLARLVHSLAGATG